MTTVRKATKAKAAPSVRDLEPFELELAGKIEIFRCPKIIIWRRTQVMVYATASEDLSTLSADDLKHMEARLDEFFTASMGAPGYKRFNKRFLDADDELDEQHLIYAIAAIMDHFKDQLEPLAALARVSLDKLIKPIRDA